MAGKFDKWDATLTFDSPDETTGVLYVKIQPHSVDRDTVFETRRFL